MSSFRVTFWTLCAASVGTILRQRGRFIEAFKSSVDLLASMPELGRVRVDLGAPETRSWRVHGFRNYLIFYEVLPDRLRLLRVLHGSGDLQAELGR